MAEAHFSLIASQFSLAKPKEVLEDLIKIKDLSLEQSTKLSDAIVCSGVIAHDLDLATKLEKTLIGREPKFLYLSINYVDQQSTNSTYLLDGKKSNKKRVLSEIRKSNLDVDLYFAVADFDTKKVKEIIDNDQVNLDILLDGAPIIVHIMSLGNVSLLERVHQSGYDFNKEVGITRTCWFGSAKIEQGKTTLACIAAMMGNVAIFRFVANSSFTVLESDSNGVTPIDYAARKGSLEIVSDLIARGANVNAVDSEGYTPLFRLLDDCFYAESGVEQLAMLQKMESLGASLSHITKSGANIRWVASHLYKETFDYLVDKGFDTVARPSDAYAHECQQTNLYLASLRRDYDYIAGYFETNSKDDQQAQATLHLAVSLNDLLLLKALIDVGVPAHLTDSDGRFAHEAASELELTEIETYLKEKMKSFFNLVKERKEVALPLFESLIYAFISIKNKFFDLHDPAKTIGENSKNWSSLKNELKEFEGHDFYQNFDIDVHGTTFIERIESKHLKDYKIRTEGQGNVIFKLSPVFCSSTLITISFDDQEQPRISSLSQEHCNDDDW